MKFTRWRPSDVLDFELLMEADRLRSADELRDLDSGFEAGALSERRDLFRGWLRYRRERDEVSAGHRFQVGLRLFAVFMGVMSLLAGIGVSLGFLQYRGDQLINVTAFFGIAVGLQLLALLLTFLMLGVNRFRPEAGSWILGMLRLQTLARQIPMSFPCLRNRVFTVLQICGVAFNVGILLCLHYRVAFYDLAFGWATTLDLTAEDVHGLVNQLAFAWRGWLPEAVPTLQDIEGSRIQLREGAAVNTQTAVTVWWGFLGTAVATYGLLPRLMLWAVSGAVESWRLNHLRFSNAACEALALRLAPASVRHPESPSVNVSSLNQTAEPGPEVKGTRSFTLQAPEILRDLTSLETQVTKGFGVSLSSDGSSSSRMQLFEAWRPPLEETVQELRLALAKMGEDDVLLVGLLGELREHMILAPDEESVFVWRQVIERKLKDPRVAVVAFKETTV